MGKRLRAQRRGTGGSQYRSPSHRHVDDVRLPAFAEGAGTIKDLIQAPGRTSPLAVIDFNGVTDYQLAVAGTKVGQEVSVGGSKIAAGNITSLNNIPEGTSIHNIEAKPGDGGKFVKTAGSSATIVSRGEKVVIMMPSGVNKEFNPNCRAVVGVVAGGGRGDKPLAKAGKNYLTLRSRSTANKWVKGVAMNAVDHPHGGGSHPHVGGPNCQRRTASPGQKAGFIAPKKKRK
ncbi:50S ribosomal protein L2 [Candidatus Methanoplasma termitum]|uniref:50S ribosomal protein L2 n=1 Tax=Candidatus Methanoplasma termitum TaxID=1577791 RepID=A0A0A7LCN8_9ARCH|nr:50S ribosomal protein L2 [Candidatus Methanoplasma termitum]AIZ56834.1 50S ribosomal protein L2 [Candidatus Methanoplasma termitum]MCL2334282.1 50S ribosomal protein L2 [Candidatus Methanoplasma sp.]